MNLMRILFSFYLLALSLMPCTDLSDASHQHENVQTESAHSDSDHHEECEDTCPPFCSCSCCGITMAFFYPDVFTFVASSFGGKRNAILNQSATSLFNPSIWQPPKI